MLSPSLSSPLWTSITYFYFRLILECASLRAHIPVHVPALPLALFPLLSLSFVFSPHIVYQAPCLHGNPPGTGGALMIPPAFHGTLSFLFFFFLPPPSFIFSTNLSVYPSAPHAEYKCPAIGVWILWFSTCQAAYVPVFPPCGLPLTLWGKCSADPFVFVRRKVILIFRVGTGRLQPRSHRNEKELEKLSRIVALEILKERFSWCIGFRIVPCQSDISLPL